MAKILHFLSLEQFSNFQFISAVWQFLYAPAGDAVVAADGVAADDILTCADAVDCWLMSGVLGSWKSSVIAVVMIMDVDVVAHYLPIGAVAVVLALAIDIR